MGKVFLKKEKKQGIVWKDVGEEKKKGPTRHTAGIDSFEKALKFSLHLQLLIVRTVAPKFMLTLNL